MMRVVSLGLFLLLGTVAQAADVIRMAVTTSFHNSGLADVLLPEIAKDLNLEIQLLVVGTGQALKLGRAGDVDAILVHSQAAERAFVADGYGPYRREIMYNDFIIVGPSDDPARIANADSAIEALQAISRAQVAFVSRGDDSGTHKKEMSLWSVSEANLDGTWYKAVGAGMGAALNTASGLNGYILSDRASWLNFANKGDLELLYSGDPELFNQYAFLPVSSERHDHVRGDLTKKLEAWLVSPRAAELINGYTIEGEALFVFNASE